MQLRPMHVVAATLTAVTALISVGAGQLTGQSAAGQPVGRFVAYQSCQAAMWQWTADNARIGTTVGKFRHHYRAVDVWRERGGWHVQVGGKRGEPVTANNDVAYCVITGTNAQPKLTDYTFPR